MTTNKIERILRNTSDDYIKALCYVALGSRASAIDTASFCANPQHAVPNIRRMSRERAVAALRGV